jgi:hypothetical protein
MSYLYMRECTKEVTKSELQRNKRSQSASVCELYRSQDKLYRSQDKLYRSHSKGNGRYTAYVMQEAGGSTAEWYSGRRLREVVRTSLDQCRH